MPRSLARTALGVAAVTALSVAGLVGAATPAAAAGSFTPYPGAAVTGDITGDGVSDQTVFGRFGSTSDLTTPCGVRITPGGGGATSTLTLPVKTSGTQHTCPDLGTVMVTRAGNRLATATFSGQYYASPDIQIFALSGARMLYKAGLAGEAQPSVIGSQDFDGDGYGDLWESTDEGSGFTAWYVRGTSTRTLFSQPGAGLPSVSFADLNRGKGTDILLTTGLDPSTGHSLALVVDGLTGADQDVSGSLARESYTVTLVDINHDSLPDLKVVSSDFGGGSSTQYWLNTSRGKGLSFAPTSQTPAAEA